MSSADLNELRRHIRRMEFNRTEPQILVELIDKAIAEGRDLGRELRRVRKNAERISEILLKEELVKEVNTSDLDTYLARFFVGIDGSCRVIRAREGEFYSMISAVIAKFPKGMRGDVEVSFGDIQLVKIFDPSGEKVRAQTEDLMLEAETKALIRFIRKEMPSGTRVYILLDGPVVDPPRPTDKGYVNRRVKAIIDGIYQNAIVIGYVKRIKGVLFKRLVERFLNERISVFRSDYDLILSSMLMLNSRHGDEVLYYTMPQEFPYNVNSPISKAYQQYKDAGLRIYYSYSMIGTSRPPFRIDIAFRGEPTEDLLDHVFEEALKAITSITPPGIRYPLPIFVAHDKARIRKGAAEIIIFEIMSRAIATGGDPILTRLKSLLLRMNE